MIKQGFGQQRTKQNKEEIRTGQKLQKNDNNNYLVGRCMACKITAGKKRLTATN